MIVGIGVDMVNISRFSKKKQEFALRILSEYEYQQWQIRHYCVAFLAKRFAAKEAFAKALNTGIRNNINFKDIEIRNDPHGAPYILLYNKTNQLFKTKATDLHISITDEKEYATAMVIIENNTSLPELSC